MTKKISNLGKFYENAHEFIPICCHFDEKTLLTKDGELIQTIQINGINQENISMNLLGLREIIRNTLRKNVNSTDLACWIHTIRRKVNLDDPTLYPNLFSQNVHNIWVRKNYWDDKFINTLFISFVYKGSSFKVSNHQSLIKSFKKNALEQEHEEYLQKARTELENVVSAVAADLNEFGAQRLGIVVNGEDVYCEMLSLFYGLLRFIEVPIKLEETDLSKVIGSFGYAVGSNKIEVISQEQRKYASILTIKEYQDVSAKSLDRLLQQPTEFVITEVFHFVEPQVAKNMINYQNYIIKVSGDEDLAKQKGITTMLESGSKYKIPFCTQQISVLIMNEDLDVLERSVNNASFQLSRLGLVHIREDINIENAFWAQVPSNFKYLRRLKPMSVDTVASMASLHNFPAGSHTNPWGKAVTLLRSERGTPYFFNFHNNTGAGRCLVIGNSRSGKTILANFLISEAIKYNPAVLFITYANDSKVFMKVNAGKWIDTPFKLDPFRLNSINNNPLFISEFLRAMTNDNYAPLSEAEKEVLNQLTQFILTIPSLERSFSKIAEFNFESEAGTALKQRMIDYLPGGQYHEFFIDDGRWEQEADRILAINFSNYADAAFAKINYPAEEKLLPEYQKKFEKFSIFRELWLYCNVLKFADKYNAEKQIIKIENFNTLCTAKFSLDFYKAYFDRLNHNKNIYINSIQFSVDIDFFTSELWKEMQGIFLTKIYLPAESVIYSWKEKLLLTDYEFQKLKSIIPATRLFIVKQDGLAITCELSLGGLPGIINIMSALPAVIEKCNKVIEEKGEDPQNWLIEFYDSLR